MRRLGSVGNAACVPWGRNPIYEILTVLVLSACLVGACSSVCAVEDVRPCLNAGGVSSGVDPDGIRRSSGYAIVDSLGQFVVGASESANYQIEHGYWSSPLEIGTVVTLGEAKTYQDGTLLEVADKVVTAGNDAFANRFYIQEEDKSSGLQIRYGVVGGPLVTAGYAVAVAGRLNTIDGERVLEYPYVRSVSYGWPIPDPLFMVSRDAGGESLNEYTAGVWRGLGVHNVGLLVRMFGRVVYKDPGGGFFYLDDGSSIDDGSGWGIRVVCTDLAPGNTITLPAVNKFVKVSGIVSTAMVQSEVVRCIRPRYQSDIVIVPPPTP